MKNNNRKSNPEFFVGIDIGATNIKYLAVSNSNKILLQGEIITENSSYEKLIAQIENIKAIISEKTGNPPASLGILFPGFIDTKEKILRQSPNLKILDGKRLWDDIQSVSGNMPFFIDNDANGAAYGEFSIRQERMAELSDLIFLTFGSGVGGGIVSNGDVLRGSRGLAGELGHIKIRPDGRRCGCGSTGCAETYLSSYGIIETYREIVGALQGNKQKPDNPGMEPLSTETISGLAYENNEEAKSALKQTGKNMGLLLSILINTFNPQIICLGGGIMKSADMFLPHALSESEKKSIKPSFSHVKIEISELGTYAGAFGAALLGKNSRK